MGVIIFLALVIIGGFVILYRMIPSRTKSPAKLSSVDDDTEPQDYTLKIDYNIYDGDEFIESNVWYRKSHWKNPNLLAYLPTYSKDWRIAEPSLRVRGISFDNRQKDFLELMNADGFYMSVEPEPKNPKNPNAIKIMAHGKKNGQMVSRQIGYLPDEIANIYAGQELDIRPSSVLLPDEEFVNLSIEFKLLDRSAAYLKKQKKTQKIS